MSRTGAPVLSYHKTPLINSLLSFAIPPHEPFLPGKRGSNLSQTLSGETPRGKPRGINLVQAALAPCLPVPVFECTAEERQRGRYIHGASPVVLCAVETV